MQPLTPQNVEARRHEIGYVIQDGGLFPHLTAGQNVSLLARFLGRPPGEIERAHGRTGRTGPAAPRVAVALPANLSGGQRQRVGLMRALMLDPPLLLFDEPLGALDPITRSELQEQLKEIFARLNKTVVLVTHDMGEAAYFGDTIVLMRPGKIVQTGTLDDLLQPPRRAVCHATSSAPSARPCRRCRRCRRHEVQPPSPPILGGAGEGHEI